MAYTKYSLTPANNTAAPPDGAPEGMLPSAVNDTMRDMMAQIRDCGDGIRDGTYTMTAPKITGGTITGATFTGNTFSNPIVTGVSTFAAGTVSAPAITTTGDTNTGIFFPAADTIAFTEGGAEAMRIDSSGNVGIGTSSPAVKLQVNSASDDIFRMVATAPYLSFYNGSTRLGYIRANTGNFGIVSEEASTPMTFYTNTNERMRIDSSGNLLVNATSAVSNEKLFVTTNASQNIIGARLGASGSNATCFLAGNATGATSFDYFGAYDGSGTKKAGITSAGTFQSATNTYGGTSDERLKENITDATPKLNDLLKVRIRNFNFKSDEQKLKQIGVVAQELETVFPGLVEDTPTWNENNESTGTVKNVKYSVFVPMLIKAIQELKAELDSVKAELQTLKGN